MADLIWVQSHTNMHDPRPVQWASLTQEYDMGQLNKAKLRCSEIRASR